MSDWMIFAERLSEQIKKQNLSIRQLAERMDMTPTTIFRYAKGRRVPRASEILKASDALGVTCDYLVGLSDDPKKTSRPSAQPEIIRCKDCKHYYFADNRIPQEQRYTCELDGDRWKPDDYCSFGERKNRMNQCDICEEMGCRDCENCSLGNPCYDCEDYDRITKSCTSNGGCADMRGEG